MEVRGQLLRDNHCVDPEVWTQVIRLGCGCHFTYWAISPALTNIFNVLMSDYCSFLGIYFFCWLIVLFVAMEYTVITFPWLPYLGASVWAWFWLCFRVFSDLFMSDCNNLPFLCSPTATWELVFLLKVWTWIDYQVHLQVNYSIVRALGLTFLVKIFKWYWVFF